MDIECDNAEAHAWAELAIVYRNQIPRRPAKESPEEAEFERLTKIAVKHYVRGKELKEKWLEEKENEGGAPSTSEVAKAGEAGTADDETTKTRAADAPPAGAPSSMKATRAGGVHPNGLWARIVLPNTGGSARHDLSRIGQLSRIGETRS